ncbi:hypothetical protein HYU94_00475 [Candidatus Daviesbacteria bacterium]|nr:hypothetical protein [Candidatus Daviesbacteria bacterium]
MRKIFLLIIISLVPTIFLMRAGFFPIQDDLQAFRIHQMTKCFLDLQIPCRWVPDMGYQYGYPQFNYYPPSIYYLGGVIHLLGIQIIDTVKILFILGFVFSALTMFLFLKDFFKEEWPAFIGTVLYTFLPYKAAEVFVRGSMSEFWAFVFFPLIFWSSYKLIQTNKIKYVGWLALSTGLLLITHNLMSFVFLPVFGAWVILLLFAEKKWRLFFKLFLGFLLGLGLAAFFILPVIFESKYVHLETLLGGYFDYRQHFVDLNQLFISNHFGYGSSYLGPNDDLSLSVGQVHWVLGLLAVILGIINFRKLKKIAVIILTLSALELIVLFLMHQKSSFIWEKLPVLVWLQFPWRFLSVSGFLLSFLGSITVYIALRFKKKIGIIIGSLAILGVLVLHLNFFQPKTWLNMSDKEKFSGESWEKQLTISIFDYLPIYAKLPPNKKAPDLPETLDGKVEFLSYKKGSNYQIGEVEVSGEATVRLPLFDFPGMEVTVDRKRVNFWHDDCRNQEYCLGLITFNIDEGKHTIKAQLTDTNIRRLGNIITVVSFTMLAVIFFLSKKDEKSIS